MLKFFDTLSGPLWYPEKVGIELSVMGTQEVTGEQDEEVIYMDASRGISSPVELSDRGESLLRVEES